MASHASLIRDCRLRPVGAGWCIRERVEINSGINVIAPGYFLNGETTGYYSGVYRPENDWRNLSEAELQIILDPMVCDNLHDTVYLFRLPGWIRNLYNRLKSENLLKEQEANDSTLSYFTDAVCQYLTAEIFLPFEVSGKSVNVTQSGIPSSTYDQQQNRYRGLHIDNWGTPLYSLRERGKSSPRFCVNLGTHPRSFVFINLQLCTMIDMYNCDDLSALNRELNAPIATPFAERFMSDFFNYPVLKVTLEPDEAYLAPVQNLLHDGYPLRNQAVDVNFQLSSNGFRLRR